MIREIVRETRTYIPETLEKFIEKAETLVSFEKHVWITARRKKIPVNEMSTSHIRSCIACWKGTGTTLIPAGYLGGKVKWLKIFNEELTKRQ